MNLLRDPILRLCCSPYGCTAALLGASTGRSRRFLRTFSAYVTQETRHVAR